MNKTNPSATVASLNILPVEILKSAKFTDVTLRCGESKIEAHKVMLAVRSQYFEDYFKRNEKATEIELKVNFEDLKCIILYIYQGVIVIPVDRKASFLKLAKQFSVNIDEKNIFGVQTRMENFAGNEYNEMNFQQEVAIGDGDECSNALGIVHISFEEKAKSADISEEPIEIVSTKSECRQKDKCDKHGKPNVVHINQNEFLKLFGCSEP